MKPETELPLPSLRVSPIAPAAPIEEEAEGGLNVGQLLRTLQRKWWLILGITLASTAAASAKVLTSTATYSGSLELLIQPLSAETEVISNVPETLTGPDVKKSPLNQDLLKILKSPSVLKPVAEEVHQRYPKACDTPVTASVDQADIINELCYRSIARSLTLSPPAKDSNILLVTFQDPDPQKVITVLKAVEDAYLKYSLESKKKDITSGLDFVNNKLPELRKKVNSLQRQLQDLRLNNNIIDPDSRGGQLSGQVGTFAQEQRQVAIELQQTRDIYQELTQQSPQRQEANASSALAQNPRYQTLLNSLLDIDAQIAQASTLYLDTSPDMQVLKEQRQNLLSLLKQQGQQSKQETLSKIRELKTRDQALEQTIKGLNADVDDLSGISRKYTDIQRDLAIANENLGQFLAKQAALQISSAQTENPWKEVTPPTEPQPQRESLPQNLLLGGLLGLLLGTGAALLLDKSTGVIHSDEEIQRTTRLPVLGRIPHRNFSEIVTEPESMAESLEYVGANIRSEHSGSSKKAASKRNGQSPSNPYASDPFSEAFRSLYTNLRLISSDNPIRSIAISSVMPSEGKSTVALHLAEAAAAMGQRVLLVDTDLRNPQIHKYLDLSNEKGLTNLFSGESNPALIQKFLPEPNLHIIAAGSAPFEPARLFSSRSMRLFTEKVRTAFDLVIYDTPPLLGQSDAYLIADYADGMLLVTQPGKLKQSLLDRAMEQLQIADIRVLGMVTRES